LKDLIGTKFNYLTVIKRVENKGKKLMYLCQCDCGKSITTSSSNLKNGNTKTCGCSRLNNISNQRFGRLIVIKLSHVKNRKSYWLCKCDCGNEKIVRSDCLKRDQVKSCGCLQYEHAIIKHNLSKTKIYHVWAGMKDRCLNENNKAYKHYGERGVTVCEEWQKDFMSFYNWSMQNGYEEGLSVDRINNNGNYEPSNCRWVDMKSQCNNHRRNVLITFDGKTQNIQQWANELNIKHSTLYGRLITNKWSIKRALTSPIYK
jgi:hypothetical protein